MDDLKNTVDNIDKNTDKNSPYKNDIDNTKNNLNNLNNKEELSQEEIDKMLKIIDNLSKALSRKDNLGDNDSRDNTSGNGNGGEGNPGGDGGDNLGGDSGEGDDGNDSGGNDGNNSGGEPGEGGETPGGYYPPGGTCPAPNPFPFPFPNPFGPTPSGDKCYRIEIYDPLVLDLNKDSKISITSYEDSDAYFNHKNDGVKIKTSWIGKEDGILVLDKNNSGTIDNGNELFGNFTKNSDGSMANNGFEALKAYDLNNDNVIDENDEIFRSLKVWQDLDEDAITDKGELKTLSELWIKSLNLNYENSNKKQIPKTL